MESHERFREDWAGLYEALLDEYMLDNQTRMTMKSFIGWTKKGGNDLSMSDNSRQRFGLNPPNRENVA